MPQYSNMTATATWTWSLTRPSRNIFPGSLAAPVWRGRLTPNCPMVTSHRHRTDRRNLCNRENASESFWDSQKSFLGSCIGSDKCRLCRFPGTPFRRPWPASGSTEAVHSELIPNRYLWILFLVELSPARRQILYTETATYIEKSVVVTRAAGGPPQAPK